MDIASGVARISGLGEPLTYISPMFNTQPIEKIEAIQPSQYQQKFPTSETQTEAKAVQTNPEQKASYKPGDLVSLYA